ncbi:MAG TPA: SRPBCC family protein [Gallionellaceae bacterium]|nr:SRPBCC family protein [Gallionellaceae bacterium]
MNYRFVTIWKIEAPLKAVCDAICEPQGWPLWWDNVERVEEIAPGDTQGIGGVRRYTWRGRLPYRLVFDVRVVRYEPLTVVEGVASGDVEGRGCWSFSSEGAVTTVRYEWQVRTTRAWMNTLAVFARPVIEWNHNTVMRQGGLSLAHKLNARLLGVRHT